MGRAGFCMSCTGHVPCAPLRAVLPSVWEREGGARRKQSQGRVWVTLEEMMAEKLRRGAPAAAFRTGGDQAPAYPAEGAEASGDGVQGGAEPGASTSWLCDLWQVAQLTSASVCSPVH